MPNHNSTQMVGVKVTTTDATKTTIATFQTVSDKTYQVIARIIGRSATNNASYLLAATFKNVAGTLTQVSTTAGTVGQEDNGAWDATLEISGADTTDILATVTGEAALTVYWTCALDILEG